MRSPRPCRLCRARLEFIAGSSGRPIPLQSIRTVYVVAEDELGNERVERLDLSEAIRQHVADGARAELFVSHFETCPDADSFSRKR